MNSFSNQSKFIVTSLMLFIALSSFSQNWNEVNKVVASDRAANDLFGGGSISRDYAIIGAPAEDEDSLGANTMIDAGSAYFFERNSVGNWIEVQKIVASDREANSNFGSAISISGSYAVVSAFKEKKDTASSNSLSSAGAVYIFERNALGIWNEVQKIVAPDRASGDRFGTSVSMSGNHLVVGAELEDEDTTGANTLRSAGSAYIFERDTSGIWNGVQKIVASDRTLEDRFGGSVAISENYVIVGASWEDEDTTRGNTMNQAGSAYIFEQNASGVWSESQKIVASDRAVGDWFGRSVSISGKYVFIGALLEDEDTLGADTRDASGSVYVFERDTSGVWNEVQKIVASDRSINDLFGASVSISGIYAMIGAYEEDDDATGLSTLSNAGSAYLFERNASGRWIEVSKIVASDRGAGDWFGTFVAISGDYSLVGAYREDEDTSGGNTLIRAGSAYFFERTSVVGLVENNFGKEFCLFPNPTDGNFSVDLGENYKSITTTITNMDGRTIQINNYSNSQLLKLRLEEPIGIYLLIIQSADKKAVLRIAKE